MSALILPSEMRPPPSPPPTPLSPSPSPPLSSTCPCYSDALANKDPHLILGHGGKADFRGVNNTIYAFVSSRNASLGVRTEDATFKLGNLTVEGSFMTGAFFVVRTDKGRSLYLSYETARVNRNGWGWRMVEGDCARPGNSMPFLMGPHAHKTCDDVEMSVEYSSLSVQTPDWVFTVSTQPVYNRVAGPHHRLDVKVSLLVDEMVLKPHGILGQSFDGDDAPRRGRLDVYPPRTSSDTFRTTAMAEGAIEGVAEDYVLPHTRATEFAYSRFFAKPTIAARQTTRSKSARATDGDVDDVRVTKDNATVTQVRELSVRRLSEASCQCAPSPPSS